MNYMYIDKASVSDGLGVRVVLWVSGCNLKCPGCQNPESWDFNAGEVFDDAAKHDLFEALRKPWIKGITFSGGHPLENQNYECVMSIIEEIKDAMPDKDIWLYTGFELSYDDILESKRLLSQCDVIVDGPYRKELRDITLAFKGSSNQRIIDVKQSLEQGRTVLLDIV